MKFDWKKRKMKSQVVGVFSPSTEALKHSRGSGKKPAWCLQSQQQYEWQRGQASEHCPVQIPFTGTLHWLLAWNDASKWRELYQVAWFGKHSWKVQASLTTMAHNQPYLHPYPCPPVFAELFTNSITVSQPPLFFWLSEAIWGDPSPQETLLNVAWYSATWSKWASWKYQPLFLTLSPKNWPPAAYSHNSVAAF